MTRLLWVVAFAGFVLWFGTFFLHPILLWSGHPYTIEKLASWGDSFGGISSLFAAIGFFAVVWTLQLQQRQARETAGDQHRQRFEATFFQLLKLLRESREDVAYRYSPEYLQGSSPSTPSVLHKGIDAFRAAWSEAEFRIKRLGQDIPEELIVRAYETVIHSRYEGNFGPYFRLVYTILKRIQRDKVLDEDEKAAFGNLLRSQLNSFELAVIAINSMSPISKDMKGLVAEFHLLKYLPLDSGRREILSGYHEPAAFAGRPDEADT